ncbi:MAG: LysM peptidoglycan-binding domain-containing protein [Anaerolineae bacterium]|nr:LysM peptidoglycan-binding domain-containing protein [Anaerolineae bacterium]
MRKALALLVLIMALVTACNIPRADSTPGSVMTLTPTPTTQPTAAPTTAPTAEPPTPTTESLPACTPNTTWPVYTVVHGDTLFSIAQRTGGTVDALVAANCLPDRNVIEVGQLLRVPALPVVVQPSATPPGGVKTYIDPHGRYAFDYPDGWYVREDAAGSVIVTTYDPQGGDPAMAAFGLPSMAKITFSVNPTTIHTELSGLVNEFKTRNALQPDQVFYEGQWVLPNGAPAVRFSMIPGNHLIQVLLTILNGNNIVATGLGNGTLFDNVTKTLRPAS